MLNELDVTLRVHGWERCLADTASRMLMIAGYVPTYNRVTDYLRDNRELVETQVLSLLTHSGRVH